MRPAILWIAAGLALAALLLSRKASASVAAGGSSSFFEDLMTAVGPRGIRNHNPGNIRRGGDQWQGMAAEQTDPEFVQFIAPEYGIRAMAVVLNNYRTLYGRNTIRKIITRWAPPVENDTDAYINSVARSLGVGPDDQLSVAHTPALIAAIIRHENGIQPYDVALIDYGVQLA